MNDPNWLLAQPATMQAQTRFEPSPELSPRQTWLLKRYRSLPVHDTRRQAFNLFRALRLKPSVDSERLQHSFRQLIAKYDVLRWTFPTVSERVTVRVLEPGAFDIDVVDTRQEDAERFTRRLAHDAMVSLDEMGGPLIALTVYARPDDVTVLLLRFFHAIVDGWSIGLIIRDLILGYLDQRIPAELKYSGASFSEFADWQNQFVKSGEGERELTYWRNKLCDVPLHLALPIDRPDTDAHASAFTLDKPMYAMGAAGVRLLAQTYGSTSYRVLLGACMIALYALTGVVDVPITSSAINRTSRRFQETVGWIANGIIFRERLDPNERVSEFLRRLGTTVDEALEHQKIPYHLVREAIERDFPGLETAIDQIGFGADAPLRNDEFGFNWFISQAPGTKLSFGGYECETVPVHVKECLRDLTFYARHSETALNVSLNFRGDIFSRTAALKILELYSSILTAMIQQPHETISWIVGRAITTFRSPDEVVATTGAFSEEVQESSV